MRSTAGFYGGPVTERQQGIGPVVRDANEADAAACAGIYAPYVIDTAITFETDPPTVDEMAARIAAAQLAHAWLVLDEGGNPDGDRSAVIGYAYAVPHKARPAYRWAAEVSVYLAPAATGRGGGRALYTALLERLTARGFRTVTAGMTLPNPASAGLHAALGFEPVGTYRRIGHKLGAWRDVAVVQKQLRSPDVEPPAEPR